MVDILWYAKETTASNKKERYRPAVKFRKIDKALLEKLQTGASGLDKNAPMQEEATEIQDDDSDDEEPTAEEILQGGQPQRDGRADANGPKLAFTVDSQIDINSRVLLDMISEEDVIVGQTPLSACVKTAASVEMSIDEAFDGW